MQFYFYGGKDTHIIYISLYLIPEIRKVLPVMWISHAQPPCWRNLTLYSVGFTTALHSINCLVVSPL